MGRLSVTLRKGEELCIGHDIVLEARPYSSNQVRISILAPLELRIERRKVSGAKGNQIQNEGADPAQTDPKPVGSQGPDGSP